MNPDKQSQRLPCYHYTIPQYLRALFIIPDFSRLSRGTSVFLIKIARVFPLRKEFTPRRAGLFASPPIFSSPSGILPVSPGKKPPGRRLPSGRLCLVRQFLLQVVLLVSLDHLFDHLSTTRTGLTGGQVAVVALLEVYANSLAASILKRLSASRASGTILELPLLAIVIYTPSFKIYFSRLPS